MTGVPIERLVAHRGYQQQYPENSLLALRMAIEHGARFIETDVLFSADGEPVLYHDTLMQRLSGLEGAIHMEQASTLLDTPLYEPDRLGDRFIGERIPPLSALEALLQANSELTAFVEMKRAGLQHMGAEAALQKVKAVLEGVLSRVVLISFDYAAMALARELHFPQVGVVLVRWEDLLAAEIQASRPDWVFCDVEKIPQDADLAAQGVPLALYEVTDSNSALHWLQRGAALIETFDIVGVARGTAP